MTPAISRAWGKVWDTPVIRALTPAEQDALREEVLKLASMDAMSARARNIYRVAKQEAAKRDREIRR